MSSAQKHKSLRFGYLMLVGLLGLFGVAFGRCVYLQYFHHEEAVQRAQRQQLKLIPQSARRGMIVDRHGLVLAQSVKRYSLALDPSRVADAQQTAWKVAKTLDLDADDLYQKITAKSDRQFLWVRRFLTDEQIRQCRQIEIPGIILRAEYQREYPMATVASHVLGFTDIDGHGLEGLERELEGELGCEAGLWRLRSDVGRRPIEPNGPARPARDGNIVVLTLDSMIQSFLEEQLELTVAKFQARGACGIVMDPRHFEVLALANYPTYDPAEAGRVDPALRRNKVLTDPVEPGSIFKPITVASALEGGFVTLDQQIDCLEGPYSARGIGVIREYKHYFGKIPVADVLVRSSNIGSAKIAQKMGKAYFYNMIQKFGFGQETGIGLPGEGSGILVPLSEWKWGQYALTRAAYGQGPIAATPMQLMRAFCTLANDGRIKTPRMVRAVLSPDGRTVVREFTHDSWEGDQVVSPDVAHQIVARALRGVVEREAGTAHRADVAGYGVFGKTGTAQVPRKDGRGYESNKYVSSFIAGAPAWDPQICVLIMVYEPDRSLGLGYTGGAVAAEPVGRVIEQALTYLEVPRKNPDYLLTASR